MEENWYKDQVYNKTKLRSKKCEPEDFGSEEISQKFWHTWINEDYKFDLFCPDLINDDMTLYNQKGAMKSKSVVFKIERCVDDP